MPIPEGAKKLVKDTRDNTYWFGTYFSPEAPVEASYGLDYTDDVQVGTGTLEVNMPFSAVRVYSNITDIETAMMFGKYRGVCVENCDEFWTAPPTPAP